MLSKSRYTATRVGAPSVMPSIIPTDCLAGQPAGLYPRQGPCAGQAPLAQSVERFHGKEKVNGSIPLGGSADAEQAGVTNPEPVWPRGDVAQSVRANDS